jgi:hypothetical protein
MRVFFSTKSIYEYQEDTNYIHSMQQRNALVAIRMHATKKKITKKEKSRFSDQSLGAAVLTPL